MAISLLHLDDDVDKQQQRADIVAMKVRAFALSFTNKVSCSKASQACRHGPL